MAYNVTIPNTAWVEVDPSTLSAPSEAAYNAYRDARRKANELKTSFEAAMQRDSGLANGQRLYFQYNFGRLRIATAAGQPTKTSSSRKAMSLADYLARQG